VIDHHCLGIELGDLLRQTRTPENQTLASDPLFLHRFARLANSGNMLHASMPPSTEPESKIEISKIGYKYVNVNVLLRSTRMLVALHT
jgi:hypothetical protein